jgi:hypothetical protein
MPPASAFRLRLSQSGTGGCCYQTGSTYSGTGLILASALLFISGTWLTGYQTVWHSGINKRGTAGSGKGHILYVHIFIRSKQFAAFSATNGTPFSYRTFRRLSKWIIARTGLWVSVSRPAPPPPLPYHAFPSPDKSVLMYMPRRTSTVFSLVLCFQMAFMINDLYCTVHLHYKIFLVNRNEFKHNKVIKIKKENISKKNKHNKVNNYLKNFYLL